MIVTAYIKDGRTAFEFADAAELRHLQHNRPGHKPHGGKVIEVKEWRWSPAREEYVLRGVTALRFVDNRTVSWVGQGPPL